MTLRITVLAVITALLQACGTQPARDQRYIGIESGAAVARMPKMDRTLADDIGAKLVKTAPIQW